MTTQAVDYTAQAQFILDRVMASDNLHADLDVAYRKKDYSGIVGILNCAIRRPISDPMKFGLVCRVLDMYIPD